LFGDEKMHPTQNQGCTQGLISPRSNITGVEIVLFEEFALPAVAAIIEIFHRANAWTRAQLRGEHRYDVSLVSSSGGKIASSSAVPIWTETVSFQRATTSTILVFIAGGEGAMRASSDDRLSDWLRQRYANSTIVYPISEGKFILDAVGLPGRYHVPRDDARSARHIHRKNQSGNAANAIETALHVVKQDLGVEMLRFVAHALSPVREPSDASSACSPSPQRVSDKIMASARWLDENVDRHITIEFAADVAAMSERNFLRRFKAEIGMTPSDYLQRARLEMSCRMLLESQLSVDTIARRCGIGSGGQLAKLFKKHLSITPTVYRLNKADPEQICVRSSNFERGE
jgi:transcriptional regulator GlxA family with amidase domain